APHSPRKPDASRRGDTQPLENLAIATTMDVASEPLPRASRSGMLHARNRIGARLLGTVRTGDGRAAPPGGAQPDRARDGDVSATQHARPAGRWPRVAPAGKGACMAAIRWPPPGTEPRPMIEHSRHQDIHELRLARPPV